jgi:hypothetical protein
MEAKSADTVRWLKTDGALISLYENAQETACVVVYSRMSKGVDL